ncbi:MAG: response regulator [Candidatus Hinthialibacter antarcticus]|nr:response regulator [Candidatus Hinthialibacter antarcticus]
MQDSQNQTYKALIADDDASFRFLVKKTLSQSGFELIEASDGEEAVELLYEHPVDILLLDISMPKLDGLATCRKIRDAEDGTRIPIVIITGVDDVEAIKDSFRAGATDFIAKPINWLIFAERMRFIIRANQEQLAFLHDDETQDDLLNQISGLPDDIQFSEPVDKHVLWNLHLLERETGSEFISQLVKSYLNELPGMLKQIDDAFNNRHKKTLHEIVIRVKTKSEILGAKLMVAVAREVEHSILSGRFQYDQTIPERFQQAFDLTKSTLLQTAQDLISGKEGEPVDLD